MAFGRRGRGAHRRSTRAKIDATVPWEEPERAEAPPTTGPWDLVDVPEDGIERVDLGSLRVPIIQGVEVRVDVGPEGAIVAATLSYRSGQMQVGVYAAPRTEGIWDDVRKEILAQIAAQGGTGQEVRGAFGREVTARLPAQGGGSQQARFVGVNGPRWFLRALLTGQAATDPDHAAPLEEALRQMVVVRGDDPMPVRDPLPLQLPADLVEQAARQQQQQQNREQAPSPNGAQPRRRR